MKNKKCYECNGTGLIGSYHNVTCYECKGKGRIKPKSEWEKKFDKKFTGWNADTFPAIKRFIKRLLKQKWEKEFEDEIYSCGEAEYSDGAVVETFELNNNCFHKLVKKYLRGDIDKVKIKCKDGCIQIERIGR